MTIRTTICYFDSLNYQTFDKQECIDQGQLVDNERHGVVLT